MNGTVGRGYALMITPGYEEPMKMAWGCCEQKCTSHEHGSRAFSNWEYAASAKSRTRHEQASRQFIVHRHPETTSFRSLTDCVMSQASAWHHQSHRTLERPALTASNIEVEPLQNVWLVRLAHLPPVPNYPPSPIGAPPGRCLIDLTSLHSFLIHS